MVEAGAEYCVPEEVASLRRKRAFDQTVCASREYSGGDPRICGRGRWSHARAPEDAVVHAIESIDTASAKAASESKSHATNFRGANGRRTAASCSSHGGGDVRLRFLEVSAVLGESHKEVHPAI